MNAQLLELRKTLAKQAWCYRMSIQLAFYRMYGGSPDDEWRKISFLRGAYEASRKAWWTVVEAMRND